jgi:hypothetical protein
VAVESDPRARFVDQLKQLRTMAGEPTLADLEKQNPVVLKQQTVSDLLAGKGVRPPTVGADRRVRNRLCEHRNRHEADDAARKRPARVVARPTREAR